MKRVKSIAVILLSLTLCVTMFSGCQTFKSTDEAIQQLEGVWRSDHEDHEDDQLIITNNGELLPAYRYRNAVIKVFENELINSENTDNALTIFKNIDYSVWKDKVENYLVENELREKINYDLENDSFAIGYQTYKYINGNLCGYGIEDIEYNYTRVENTSADDFYKRAFEDAIKENDIRLKSKYNPVEFRESINNTELGEHDYIDSSDDDGFTLYSSKTIKNNAFGQQKFGSDAIGLHKDDDGTVRILILNVGYFQKADAVELTQLWIDSYAEFLKLNVEEMVNYAEENGGIDNRNPLIKLEYSYEANKNIYGNITGYRLEIRITNDTVSIVDLNEYVNQ